MTTWINDHPAEWLSVTSEPGKLGPKCSFLAAGHENPCECHQWSYSGEAAVCIWGKDCIGTNPISTQLDASGQKIGFTFYKGYGELGGSLGLGDTSNPNQCAPYANMFQEGRVYPLNLKSQTINDQCIYDVAKPGDVDKKGYTYGAVTVKEYCPP